MGEAWSLIRKVLRSKRFMLQNKVGFGYLEQVKRSKCAV
jgi:hypothetical protein